MIRNNLVYDVSTAYSTPGHLANGLLRRHRRRPEEHHVRPQHGGQQERQQHDFHVRRQLADRCEITGFEVTNNLLRVGTYGAIYGDGKGQGTTALNYYTPNALVLHNTFAGRLGHAVPGRQ